MELNWAEKKTGNSTKNSKKPTDLATPTKKNYSLWGIQNKTQTNTWSSRKCVKRIIKKRSFKNPKWNDTQNEKITKLQRLEASDLKWGSSGSMGLCPTNLKLRKKFSLSPSTSTNEHQKQMNQNSVLSGFEAEQLSAWKRHTQSVKVRLLIHFAAAFCRTNCAWTMCSLNIEMYYWKIGRQRGEEMREGREGKRCTFQLLFD